MKQGKLNVFSVYLPPNATFKDEEFNEILKYPQAPIMAGDFNCKHQHRNSKITNVNGQKLDAYAMNKNVVVSAPDEDTHISAAHGTTDILDIAVLKDIKWNY